MNTIPENAAAGRADYSPEGFQVMAKPVGPACNLACEYCYYLEKEALYPGVNDYRMPAEVLETFIREYIRAQPVPEVSFVWQGGEPTLAGVDFFQAAVALQQKYGAGKRITNCLQTNGMLLSDDWCRFFARHGFLVGLSLDGPEEVHDRYRRDRGGKPAFRPTMRALRLLRKHGVEFNILATVAGENAGRPREIYRFFKEQGVRFIQFLPVVELMPDAAARRLGMRLGVPPSPRQERTEFAVTPWTVEPEMYGRFLIDVFDEWVRHDVGSIFVMNFEWALASWMGLPPLSCVFMPRCGRCVVLEHNGDLYACDHYVYPDYRLGNILRDDLREMIESPFQTEFGAQKEASLPGFCRECTVIRGCRGECRKHRFMTTPDGEPGLNYLCAGYKEYFTYISPYMKWISQIMKSGGDASQIMDLIPLHNHTFSLPRTR
jgi:uncharacterized protein